MRERVAKLETQEKTMLSNIDDLETLLRKINQNGAEKVASLKKQNVSESKLNS
jgi:hypothetical protein